MALEYFLYTTIYDNTLVERSNNSFAPLPPDTGEIHVDYFIPNYQPLYYYKESGGTIVVNSEDNINEYLQGTAPAPEAEDNVVQYQFTGYTATTDTKIDNKINKITGAGGQVPVFISDGNLESSNYTIPELLNQYANVLIVAKSGATYSTIASAIAVATSGDVIYVKPGVYEEDITINKNVNLVGSCGKKTKLSGITTFTNSSNAIIFKNFGFYNENNFAVDVQCGDDDGKISLVDCYVDTVWNSSDGQSITTAKSNIKVSRGKLSVSRGRYSVISSGDNANEHNTSIYWLDGYNQVNLDVFGAFQNITNTTDQSQNLELVYNRNSNSNTSYVFKNGNIKFFGVVNSNNYVAPFYSINADNLEGIVEGNLIEINDTGNAYTAFNYGSDTPIIFTNNSILPNNVSDLYAAWSDSGTINVVQNFFNVSTKPQIYGNVNYSMTNNEGSLYLSSDLFVNEKLNLNTYSNSSETEGDLWWNGSELNFRNGSTTTNLLASSGGGTWGSITGTLSAQTDLQNALDAKLSETIFNTYTGTTAPNTFLNKNTGGVVTGDVKITESLYVTGTTATTLELQDAVLLGAITTDGKIVATTTPALNVSEAVTDVSVDTSITEISGIYYVDTTAGDVTLTIPNAASDNDAKKMSILKKAGSNNVIITTVGGTQDIGNQTTQTISQTDKGLSIVADNDNTKWIVVQDSRYVEGTTEGELQFWNNTLKVWQPTSNDITWENTDKKFTVGGNSDPQTFQVDAVDDIVYINATGLTGLATADDLGFYAGGRGAFGNSVTIDRLRNNVPGNVPRALSLIDTTGVMRIWRFVNDANDPAVEFVWGTDDAPSSSGNTWWDMYLKGSEDSFAIRRRTESVNDEILSVSETGTDLKYATNIGEKINLSEYTNTSLTGGDFWWDGDGLYIRSGTTSVNLIPPTGPMKAVQARRSTTYSGLPITWTDISFDTTDLENDSDVIEHNATNTDRIYVKEDGLYQIYYVFEIDDEAQGRVRVNDTTVIPGSIGETDFSGNNAPVTRTVVYELTGGDYVTMQAQGLASNQEIRIDATFVVVKLDGLKGDKGTDGAGAAIILQTEDVNVPNTPHGTLNFDDNFSVTDDGGGKATVSYVPTGNATDGKIQLVDSVGGQDINPIAATALTWAQEDFKDSATFTHAASGSTITVLKTGLYELSFNVNGESGNGRSEPGIQFRNNSSVIAPTLTADYGRNTSNNDTNNALPPYLISLTANDVLDVVAFRLGDATANTSKTGASFMRITYLG